MSVYSVLMVPDQGDTQEINAATPVTTPGSTYTFHVPGGHTAELISGSVKHYIPNDANPTSDPSFNGHAPGTGCEEYKAEWHLFVLLHDTNIEAAVYSEQAKSQRVSNLGAYQGRGADWTGYFNDVPKIKVRGGTNGARVRVMLFNENIHSIMWYGGFLWDVYPTPEGG